MSLVQGWLPPSRENWEFIAYAWQFFPIVSRRWKNRSNQKETRIKIKQKKPQLTLVSTQFTAFQWLTDFYPQGKTSITSRLNLPGKPAWALMESVGALTVLYCVLNIPRTESLPSLPWGNRTMAGLYIAHYIYRALIFPYLQPSMSPIHPLVFISACAWNLINGLSIGGWVGGYGPQTTSDWSGKLYAMEIGLVIWGWGFLANIFHDDDLREIRRSALRRRKEQAERDGKKPESVEKLYMLPKNGLFHYVLYAHYFCEWIEWAGYCVVGGWGCVPARSFLCNEVATMLPRALAGRRWYVEKFGREQVGNRKAVIPGVL